MDKRVKRTIVICDTDLDHSFTMEGFLRNQNYDVVNITDATELVSSVKSLRPSVVFVNPDIAGFNETEVCQQIKKNLGIPIIFLLDGSSTRRAQLADCEPDDIVTKPNGGNNLLMLVKKHISLHQQ
jgi:DNA-binding response OmpR family regulator